MKMNLICFVDDLTLVERMYLNELINMLKAEKSQASQMHLLNIEPSIDRGESLTA